MQNLFKRKRTTLLSASIIVMTAGLGYVSPAYAKSGDDSDFIKLLQEAYKDGVKWSDYSKDENGHEVIKKLDLNNEGKKISIEEVDLDNFKYDKKSEDMSADHITFKNIKGLNPDKLKLNIDKFDISKLKSTDTYYESESKITNLVGQRLMPPQYIRLQLSEDELQQLQVTLNVSEMTSSIKLDHDDLKFDIHAIGTDSYDFKFKGQLVGFDGVHDVLDADNKTGADELDPEIMGVLLLAKVSVKSLDLDYVDNDPKKESAGDHSSGGGYETNMRACVRDFGAFAPDPKAFCTPITNLVTGKKNTLSAHVHPDQPTKISDILFAAKSGDQEKVKEIVKKINFKITN